jgi:hypothetical protein
MGHFYGVEFDFQIVPDFQGRFTENMTQTSVFLMIKSRIKIMNLWEVFGNVFALAKQHIKS